MTPMPRRNDTDDHAPAMRVDERRLQQYVSDAQLRYKDERIAFLTKECEAKDRTNRRLERRGDLVVRVCFALFMVCVFLGAALYVRW